MTWIAAVSSKGQLTIPKPVRDALKLKAGAKASFSLHEGRVEMRPISSEGVLQWQGALRAEGRATPWEEVRDQVRQAIAEESVREMQGN